MKYTLAAFVFIILSTSCSQSQHKPDNAFRLVGGPCEGCDGIFEYGNKTLHAVDTLPDYNTATTKLKLTGTVYLPNGKTPASNVILYIYQTNEKGHYETVGNETGWAKRHGIIRGWVKTNNKGEYTFYTMRPAVYPSRSEPAHIHLTVLEPNGKYYWLDDFFFEGDTLLTAKHLKKTNRRGGQQGILRLQPDGKVFVGKRDIILGRNITDYK